MSDTLDPADIAWRIRRLRADRGWRQSDLAAEVGARMNAVIQWEAGRRMPSPLHLYRLADAFGTSVDYLMGRQP